MGSWADTDTDTATPLGPPQGASSGLVGGGLAWGPARFAGEYSEGHYTAAVQLGSHVPIWWRTQRIRFFFQGLPKEQVAERVRWGRFLLPADTTHGIQTDPWVEMGL